MQKKLFDLAADSAAVNFISYSSSVNQFLLKNPGFSGSVTDNQLTNYFQPGYIRNTAWSNIVVGSVAYIYTLPSQAPGFSDAVYKRTNNSIFLGTKSQLNGDLISQTGLDTGINLPASIPPNAIVMLGN